MNTKRILYGLTGALIAAALVVLIAAVSVSSQRGVLIALGSSLVIVGLSTSIAFRRVHDG
ncbi:MAG: hypothetical protein CSA84_00235 [Actinomycetales bacterium]|nr:MAG: hypothetical protein CSA84_00235 [Actinomycetales bacterium]